MVIPPPPPPPPLYLPFPPFLANYLHVNSYCNNNKKHLSLERRPSHLPCHGVSFVRQRSSGGPGFSSALVQFRCINVALSTLRRRGELVRYRLHRAASRGELINEQAGKHNRRGKRGRIGGGTGGGTENEAL